MPKTLITAALAAATLTTGGLVSQPVQASEWGLEPAIARSAGAQVEQVQYRVYRNDYGCYRGERVFDCRERLRWERRHNRRMVWRDGRYFDDETGAAIAGGILGFALGAAIAGSRDDYNYYYAHRYDRAWRARCRYLPGFDWRTGTYLGRDGYRHYCTR
jgi:hypothetical protein